MRILACLLAVLCGFSVGLAQEAIEWSLERRLARDDFRGRVPAGAQNAALSWLNIDAFWECQDAILVASARATFDPSRSWWRSTHGRVWGPAGERMSSGRAQVEARRSVVQRDSQLLEHEQLHFDLAEAVARKIRMRFNDFRNACSEAGGTDPIREIVEQADRELHEEQQRYDRETSHGLNARAQDQWKRRIRTMLN
jgi:hypothetical protein